MTSAPIEGASASGGRAEQWTVGLLNRPSFNGRLMKIPRENVEWNHGPVRRDFCEFIGSLIIFARDVVEFEAVEFALKASHLIAVGFHLGIVIVRVLHDLVNHELGITTNIEVSDPEFDGDAQPVNESPILSYIVGGSEMESNRIAHVNSKG
jgi:hypothetical protein